MIFSRQTLQLRLKMEEECLGVNKLHDSVETLSKVPLNFTRNLKLLSLNPLPHITMLKKYTHCTHIFVRNLLQLHYVHGSELCGDHHHDPQLPPPEGSHPPHAGLGKTFIKLKIT